MQGEFEMSMMGELNFFLEFQIKQMKEEIFITESKYTRELLKKLEMKSSKIINTSMIPFCKLEKNKHDKSVDTKLYRGMIGSLLYLTASRPDIIFSVCMCARYQSNSKESHLNTVKRIFKYLKRIQNLGL